jgi:D-beta-D-heptose 7-phosphate kinase / D-beta-D-heptose 1-phosphate adenosyltransferase
VARLEVVGDALLDRDLDGRAERLAPDAPVNSDASAARLKGPDRPLVPESDRAAVLEALGCVDAVLIFEEDDPRAALEVVRPDLWAKGGDYAVAELPEAETLAAWGGRAVIVPYIAGRSTTRLIEEVVARAG